MMMQTAAAAATVNPADLDAHLTRLGIPRAEIPFTSHDAALVFQMPKRRMVEPLSAAEERVMFLMLNPAHDKNTIAELLVVSTNTVHTHLKAAYAKLAASSRATSQAKFLEYYPQYWGSYIGFVQNPTTLYSDN